MWALLDDLHLEAALDELMRRRQARHPGAEDDDALATEHLRRGTVRHGVHLPGARRTRRATLAATGFAPRPAGMRAAPRRRPRSRRPLHAAGDGRRGPRRGMTACRS